MLEKTVSFKALAYGARFHYPGDKRTYVKINHRLIAEWDEKNVDTRWIGQGIYSANDNDEDIDVVIQVQQRVGLLVSVDGDDACWDVLTEAAFEQIKALAPTIAGSSDPHTEGPLFDSEQWSRLVDNITQSSPDGEPRPDVVLKRFTTQHYVTEMAEYHIIGIITMPGN